MDSVSLNSASLPPVSRLKCAVAAAEKSTLSTAPTGAPKRIDNSQTQILQSTVLAQRSNREADAPPIAKIVDQSAAEIQQERKERLEAERQEREQKLEEARLERKARLKAEREEQERRIAEESKAQRKEDHQELLDELRQQLFSNLHDLSESYRQTEQKMAYRAALVSRIDRFA